MRKPEYHLQVNIVQCLRYSGLFCFSVPNGGSRNKLEAINLKRSGVMAGVADIVILLPMGRCVFVELKSDKGRQSESQKIFQAKAEELGFEYLLWKSLRDAEEFVKNYKKDYLKVGGTE